MSIEEIVSTLGPALTAIGGGIAGAFTAWLLNFFQSSGQLIVTWRPREDGFTTIDVIARNAGTRRLKSIEITSDGEDFKPIEFDELPAGTEHRIDTLSGKSQKQQYYTRYGWRRRLRWRATQWQVDPAKFAGVKIGHKTAVREIADILENVEKHIRDSPVVRNMGNTVSISRPGKEHWMLPAGVLAVLVPDGSETLRKRIQDETAVGSSWRQNRSAGSSVGTHTPKEILRVVFDPEVLSSEDEKQLEEYFDHGHITIHWNRNRKHWPTAEYMILGTVASPKEARVIERHVAYQQPQRNAGD